MVNDATQPTAQAGRSALLVVDMQAGVLAGSWDTERVIDRVGQAVQRARAQGVPVVWVQHQDDELPHGSANWQLVPALQPVDGELRIAKRFNSAFEDTPLQTELARRGVGHVVLAGALTSWCIRATAYAALERGFDLTLLKDAHTTQDMALEGGPTIAAAHIVAEFNTVMQWLSLAARRCGTASAEAVAFRAA